MRQTLNVLTLATATFIGLASAKLVMIPDSSCASGYLNFSGEGCMTADPKLIFQCDPGHAKIKSTTSGEMSCLKCPAGMKMCTSVDYSITNIQALVCDTGLIHTVDGLCTLPPPIKIPCLLGTDASGNCLPILPPLGCVPGTVEVHDAEKGCMPCPLGMAVCTTINFSPTNITALNCSTGFILSADAQCNPPPNIPNPCYQSGFDASGNCLPILPPLGCKPGTVEVHDADKGCMPCPFGMAVCTTIDFSSTNITALTCSTGFILSADAQCNPPSAIKIPCPNDTIVDSTGKCLPVIPVPIIAVLGCVPGTVEVHDADKKDCLPCPFGMKMCTTINFSSTNITALTCSTGFILSADAQCNPPSAIRIPCPKDTFTDSDGNCSPIISVLGCVPGTVEVHDADKQNCMKCPFGMAVCITINFSSTNITALTCSTGFILSADAQCNPPSAIRIPCPNDTIADSTGKCLPVILVPIIAVLGCVLGTVEVHDADKKSCMPCPSGMAVCHTTDYSSANVTADSCIAGFALKNAQCLICPAFKGSPPKNTSPTCTPCGNKNAVNCQTGLKRIDLACQSGFYLPLGTCKKCSPGFSTPYDNSDKLCQSCPPNVLTCDFNVHPTGIITCKSGYTKLTLNNLPVCAKPQ